MRTVNRLQAGCFLAISLLGATEKTLAEDLPSLQLRVTEPSPANEFKRSPELEWNGMPGMVYWVQTTTNLADPASWVTVEPVKSEVGPVRWMAPESLRDSRYYRLEAQPEIFRLEPSFIDSSDSKAVLYILGQLLPTNATVLINGQSFVPEIVNSNGVWATVSLKGLAPGAIIGIAVGSVVVQSALVYGTAMTPEQLQGPPMEPPASPEAQYLSRKGYDYYKAQSDLSSAGLNTNPYFVENENAGQMPEALLAAFLSKKGYDYYQAQSQRSSARPHRKTGHVTILKRGDAGGTARLAGGRAHELKGHVTLIKREIAPGGGGDDDCDGLGVFPATGEFRCQETDLEIPGVGLDFAWTRTYRSRTGPSTVQGAGWDYSYNVSLGNLTANTVDLHTGDGRTSTFYRDGTNGWFREEYFLAIGDLDGDGIPDLVTFPDGGQWTFHPPGTAASGKLHQIIDRNHNILSLNYDGAGRLATVVDTLNRTNTVAYNAVGLLESVTDFSGRTVRYEYDGHGDLVSCVAPPVTGTPTGNDFPGGKTNRYAYSSGLADGQLNHNLTSCTDAKGQTWLRISYAPTNDPTSIDYDAVTTVQRGIDKKDIRRIAVTPTPDNDFAMIRAIVNDYAGNVTEWFYDSRLRCVRLLEFTGRADPTLPTTATENRPTGKLRADDPDYFETKWNWNPDSLCTREIRPAGDSTEIVHQRVQDHNSSRSNKSSRRHDGDVRVLRERASSAVDTDGDGVADTSELAWYFEYDPRFGSPASRVMVHKIHRGEHLPSAFRGPRQTTSLDGAFDGDNTPIIKGSALGGLSRSRGWNGTVKTTSSARVITDRDTGRSKGFGFVTTVTDSRGKVTTESYDDRGNCLKVRVPSLPALQTDFAYNASGQVIAITNAPDGNGYRSVDRFSYYTSGPQGGCLESITIDEGGVHLTTAFEYDSRGNVTRCIDPRGNDTLFTYNALDQCVRSQSPVNLSSRCATDYLYDENDNLAQITTELRDEKDTLLRNVATMCTYDLLDRCTAVIRQVAKGHSITDRFDYDANGNVVAVHSPLAASGADPNARTILQYDERGLLFREIGAPVAGISPSNEFGYSRNGMRNRILELETVLRQTSVAFDGFQRPATLADPMGNVVTFAYDRNDNLVLVRHSAELNDVAGSAGNVRCEEWRWRYDQLDRCIESRLAFFDPATQLPLTDGAAITSFTYAPNGDCLSVTDDNGHTTTYAYDTAGRCSQVTDPKANVTQFIYDAGDNLTGEVSIERPDSLGPEQRFATSHTYDSLGRCVQSVDNAGNTNLCAWDSLDRPVRRTDPKGIVSWLDYDDLGRLTRTVGDLDGDGLADLAVDVDAAWTYDDNSRCVATTDDNTNTTAYAYDSLGRCVSVTGADGTSCSLVWSPRSNLLRQQDANGTVVSNRFDLLDRCVGREIIPGPGVAAATTFELFAYDGLSRCVAASNDVSLATFAFDSLGNCIRSTQDGLLTTSTHDGVGNCVSMTYPGGRIVTCAYNPLGEVVSVSTSAGGGLPSVTMATYAYEGPGRLGRITRANNINTRLQWNGLVNPANAPGDFGWRQVSGVNHQVANGGATIDRRTFAYDRNQNKTARAQTAPFFSGAPTTTNLFAYDALNRLTQFSRASGSADDFLRVYGLDGNGNRRFAASNGVAQPYVMDSTLPPGDFQMNQYTLTPFGLQTFDENGNRTSRASAVDELQFAYDYDSRLVAVHSLLTGTPVPVASYSYDALGRRISKTVYPGGLPPLTTQFVVGDEQCDDGDPIEERENGAVKRTYVMPHVFEQKGSASFRRTHVVPHILERKGGIMFTAGGEVFHFHCDELGNTLALTDAGGKVVERYDYDDCGAPIFLSPDGVPTGEAESGVGNPFLFHGLAWEPQTGLYRVSSGDYFDPQSGESTSRLGTGGMPNRISMNVTVPKQTQGATFGEKVNAGINPWSSVSGGRMQKGTVKFFNETKGFGFASADPVTITVKLIVPIAMDKGLRFAVRGGGAGGTRSTKAQDHNSSRSNKTASVVDPPGGGVVKFIVKK